jgi:hypothetical protein
MLSMPLLEVVLLLGITSVGTIYVYNYLQGNRDKEKLLSAFYSLLAQQDSCVSLIQLTAIAGVETQKSKLFLDEQVRTLGGMLEIDDRGDSFYRFPKLNLPTNEVLVDNRNNDDW